MDDEIKNLIKVWITVHTSLCYCYYVASHIPKGMLRLMFLLPVFYVFTILPFNLSSFHLGGPTFFFLVWLGSFKLLLFSFDLGPLSLSSSSTPSNSLLHFISIASLPIKIKQHPSPKSVPNTKIDSTPPPNTTSKLHRSIVFALKCVILCVIICVYDYKQCLHPNVVLILYCCHMYLGLDIALAISAAPVRAILGFEIEPHSNEPYLSTSLQDFWGRRWNLMVTSILRPTVYEPVRRIVIPILSPKSARVVAIFATFLVSGLMHELIYYYCARVSPTWEVTWFFVLHGVCTGIEIVVKKAFAGRCHLHGAISGPLTLAFLAATGSWLFFPQLLRNGVDERAIAEYSIVKDFIRHRLLHSF